MSIKYDNFFIKFKCLDIEFKLLDDSAFFPNQEKKDKKEFVEEFKIIVKNKNKEIEFKFYNSIMEREISKYLKELGYVKYNNLHFKSWIKRFSWVGYDKVKNREDLIKQRIINLSYSVLNSIAMDINNDLSSFSWFCSNYGYDEDSRTAEKIYKSCQELQEKLLSLNLDKEFLKYLDEEAMQETDKFKEDIIKAVQESKLIN